MLMLLTVWIALINYVIFTEGTVNAEDQAQYAHNCARAAATEKGIDATSFKHIFVSQQGGYTNVKLQQTTDLMSGYVVCIFESDPWGKVEVLLPSN